MGRTADAIAEGLTIADAAARLAIRNDIVMRTIGQGAAFDRTVVESVARDVLLTLADEQEAAADHTARLRKRVGGLYSDSDGTHDYRDRDRGNLRRRQRISAGVAKRLRERAASTEQVAALAERSRAEAWADVAANIDRRLTVESMRPESDPDYATLREARMDALRLIDLQRLGVRARRRPESR